MIIVPGLMLGWVGCGDQQDIADHIHDAEDIASGKLDNERLNMGEGSGIDADQLDGYEASDLALADHTHDGVDADLLDGRDSSEFATADHVHRPVLWVGGASSQAGIGTFTYILDQVEADTTSGHLTVDPNGTVTINTPGFYRIRAWSQASCSSVLGNAGTLSQSLLKNGTQVGGSTVLHPAGVAHTTGAKHDSTYLGLVAAGDTFTVEYICSLPGPMGDNCVAHSSVANGASGVQIQYLGGQ
jgi:hypothetical protein